MENIKTKVELEEEFYSKPLCLSYSGLNKLLYSPKVYYNHYVLKQREDKTEAYLIEGKVVHCLLLEDGSFQDKFIVSPASLPTDSTKKVVDKVFEGIAKTENKDVSLHSLSEPILAQLKEINLHQSLKTDDQRLSKVITEESISYFEFLKQKESKDIIDADILKRCTEAVDALRSDHKICDLLGVYKSEMENVTTFNEIELAASAEELGLPVGLKGVLDNLRIDYDKKIIYINDVKTTGKTLTDFPETIYFYRYDMQAAIYNRLVRYVHRDVLTEDWQIVFNFIVIDKYKQVYAFEVTDLTMEAWDVILLQLLNEANWHYQNKNYNVPYMFATSQVKI